MLRLENVAGTRRRKAFVSLTKPRKSKRSVLKNRSPE
jgi:hypothetical protein